MSYQAWVKPKGVGKWDTWIQLLVLPHSVTPLLVTREANLSFIWASFSAQMIKGTNNTLAHLLVIFWSTGEQSCTTTPRQGPSFYIQGNRAEVRQDKPQEGFKATSSSTVPTNLKPVGHFATITVIQCRPARFRNQLLFIVWRTKGVVAPERMHPIQHNYNCSCAMKLIAVQSTLKY